MPVPALLGDRLPSDGAIWCHHALWHSRVYLDCIQGHVGETIPWKQAGAVVASLHGGRSLTPQWNALNAYLAQLREAGLIEFSEVEGRIAELAVMAELQRPRSP